MLKAEQSSHRQHVCQCPGAVVTFACIQWAARDVGLSYPVVQLDWLVSLRPAGQLQVPSLMVLDRLRGCMHHVVAPEHTA